MKFNHFGLSVGVIWEASLPALVLSDVGVTGITAGAVLFVFSLIVKTIINNLTEHNQIELLLITEEIWYNLIVLNCNRFKIYKYKVITDM